MSTVILDSNECAASAEVREDKLEETPVFQAGLLTHLRRISLEIVNFICHHDFFWKLLGRLNSHLGIFKGVFLVYPADESYTLSYFYPFRAKKIGWQLQFAGVLLQNGRLSLMFCVTVNQEDLIKPENDGNLREVMCGVQKLAKHLNITRVTSAGILPGTFFARRIIREAPEADLTAEAVEQAIKEVALREVVPPNASVIVLGGRGFIGRRLIDRLTGNIYSIDINCGASWPTHLKGMPVIVVNVTKRYTLSDYIPMMWPGTVVVNEVYPAPEKDTLTMMKSSGIACYHVVGVQGLALPAFPNAYQGAIPCCAAWPSPEMKVVVRKL